MRWMRWTGLWGVSLDGSLHVAVQPSNLHSAAVQFAPTRCGVGDVDGRQDAQKKPLFQPEEEFDFKAEMRKHREDNALKRTKEKRVLNYLLTEQVA